MFSKISCISLFFYATYKRKLRSTFSNKVIIIIIYTVSNRPWFGAHSLSQLSAFLCRAVQCCEAFKTEVSLSLYTVIAPSGTT